MFFLISLLDMIDSEEGKIKFEKFYYKYIKLVMHVSLKHLNNNKHLAEENCQDVFTYLAKNFKKVGEIDSKITEGYVYTVATGLAINKFNKEIKNRNEISENETVVQIFDETFDLYSVTELKAAIESLSDEEKSYYRLKHLNGLTLKEIGDMYGESASTVSRKLQKITKKLKDRLGDNNE